MKSIDLSHVSDVRRSAMVAWGTTCMQSLMIADVTDSTSSSRLWGSTLGSPSQSTIIVKHHAAVTIIALTPIARLTF